MGAAREWASALCAAVIMCAAVNMISPGEKRVRCFRMVLSAVMLCLLVSPLSGISSCRYRMDRLESEPPWTDSGLLELVEEQTSQAMSRSVCGLVRAELEEMGIAAEEITAHMDISPDGCITIGQVRVSSGSIDEDRRAEIISRLYERLGMDVELICAED